MKRWRGVPRHLLRVAFSPLTGTTEDEDLRCICMKKRSRHLLSDSRKPSEWTREGSTMPVLGTNRSGWTVFRQHHARELQWEEDKASPSAHVPLGSDKHGHREPLVAKEQKCTHISSRRRESTGWIQGRVPSIYQKGPFSAATSQLPFCIPPAALVSEVCTFSHSSHSAENFLHLDTSQQSPTPTPSHMAAFWSLLIQIQEKVNLAVDQMAIPVQSADAGDVKNDIMWLHSPARTDLPFRTGSPLDSLLIMV